VRNKHPQSGDAWKLGAAAFTIRHMPNDVAPPKTDQP
jgi:hypothetical protein